MRSFFIGSASRKRTSAFVNNICQKSAAFHILLTYAVIFPLSGQSLPEQVYFNDDSSMLLSGGIQSTGFYDESVVRNIYLDFYEEGFWQQMLDNYNTSEYVLATLRYEDIELDSVSVQFKGQTSFRNPARDGSEKLSFSIKLDEVIGGQDIEGYNNLNLNNAFGDPSFMKEALYAKLSRQFLPALKVNFLRLYLNNEDWGLYVNAQQLNGDFLKEWYPDNDGIRWRADVPGYSTIPDGPPPPGAALEVSSSNAEPPPGGGANWGDGTAALNYLGSDTSLYQEHYTLKDTDVAYPWDHLVKVCDILNNTPLENLEDSLSEYMDIDATLWFLAQEILFSDDDSYVYKGKMDYYLFYDLSTGKIIPLEFDGNSAMALRNAQWSPFYHEDSINYPLLNRLLAVPELRQRYIAHAKTMITEGFDLETANEVIDFYDAQISSHVASDPKIDFNMFRYNRVVDDLRTFIKERSIYVMNNDEFTKASPVFGEVNQEVIDAGTGSDEAGEHLLVTASASHPEGIRKMVLYYGAGIKGSFEEIVMLDNGTEGDEVPGDGIFTGTTPLFLPGTLVRYYVEAVADDPVSSVSFMPAGAAYDVFAYRVPLPSGNSTTGVVINEFMASNDHTAHDEFGEFDDWVELFNNSAEPVDLSQYTLSDDSWELQKWTLPDTVINSGEYLIVWTDGDDEQGPMHAGFKLSADGEEIILSDATGKVVQQVTFASQTTDISYGRSPNGTGDFTRMNPTFGGFNNQTVGTPESGVQTEGIKLYPNPVSDHLIIDSGAETFSTYRIISATGSLIQTGTLTGKRTSVNTSGLLPGFYLMVVESGKLPAALRFIKN